jgi:hypothetical protein
MRALLLTTAAAFAVAAASPAAAVYQNYNFSGEIVGDSTDGADGVPIGTAFTGSIQFNDTAPSFDTGDGTIFADDGRLSLTMLGYTLNTRMLGTFLIDEATAPGTDVAELYSIGEALDAPPLTFLYSDTSGATPWGTALPSGPNFFPATLSLPQIGLTEQNGPVAGIMITLDYDGNVALGLVGGIDTITYAGTSPLPEPANWALMLAGFGAVGGAIRYGRARRAVRFA